MIYCFHYTLLCRLGSAVGINVFVGVNCSCLEPAGGLFQCLNACMYITEMYLRHTYSKHYLILRSAQLLRIHWTATSKKVFGVVRPAKIQLSLHIRAIWSESSQQIFWIAKGAKFLHTDNVDWSDCGDEQANLNLRCAHMSEGTYSVVVAPLSRTSVHLVFVSIWCCVNINGFLLNLVCALMLCRSGLGLLMGKLRQLLTELSARDAIMAGYYSLMLLFGWNFCFLCSF